MKSGRHLSNRNNPGGMVSARRLIRFFYPDNIHKILRKKNAETREKDGDS